MECGLGLWIGMSICLHRAFLYLALLSDPPLPPPPDWLLERWPSRARSLRTASRSARGKARSPPNHSQQAAELDKSEEALVGPAQLRVWFIFPNSTMRARQCKPSPVSLKTLYILAAETELSCAACWSSLFGRRCSSKIDLRRGRPTRLCRSLYRDAVLENRFPRRNGSRYRGRLPGLPGV